LKTSNSSLQVYPQSKVNVDQFSLHLLLKYCRGIISPGPGVCGALDGFYLAADLFGGEAIEPALPDHHQHSEDSRQTQHHCLELPEEMFLHQSGATAGRRRRVSTYIRFIKLKPACLSLMVASCSNNTENQSWKVLKSLNSFQLNFQLNL